MHFWGVDVTLDNVSSFLMKGISPYSLFDEIEHNDIYRVVKLKGVYNYITNDNKLLFEDKWFDYCDWFNKEGGEAIVEKGGLVNFINANGEYISEVWFKNVRPFKGALAIVKTDSGFTYMNRKGKFPIKKFFLGARDFFNQRAIVRVEEGWTCIDKKGDYLIDIFFNNGRDCYEYVHKVFPIKDRKKKKKYCDLLKEK